MTLQQFKALIKRHLYAQLLEERILVCNKEIRSLIKNVFLVIGNIKIQHCKYVFEKGDIMSFDGQI